MLSYYHLTCCHWNSCKFLSHFHCGLNLLCNFIEIALRHGCSPVNLLHVLRTPFPKHTSGGLLSQHQSHSFKGNVQTIFCVSNLCFLITFLSLFSFSDLFNAEKLCSQLAFKGKLNFNKYFPLLMTSWRRLCERLCFAN